MKKVIAIVLTCAMIFGTGIVVGNEITGTATVTAGGNKPIIQSIDVKDSASTAWPGNLDPGHEYHLYVNISDADTIDNIASLNVDIYDPYNPTETISRHRYTFSYTETASDNDDIAGTFAETNPTDYVSLNLANCQAPNTADYASQATESYIFAFILDVVAVESTGWYIDVTVTDANANTDSELLTGIFRVNPYISMDFDTGGVSHDFDWSGLSGNTYSQNFDVTVSSNDAYTLSAKYTGYFSHATESYSFTPNLKVGTDLGSAQSVPNATAPNPDTYVDFHTGNYAKNGVTSWTMFLTIPSATYQGTYTGPTIYILATNS